MILLFLTWNTHRYFSGDDSCNDSVTLSLSCVVENASQLSKQLKIHGSGIFMLNVRGTKLPVVVILSMSCTINPSFLVISSIFMKLA